MSEITTVVPAITAPSGTDDGIIRGQATVSPNQTLQVATVMFPDDRLLFGFIGTGDGDGFFQLKVDSAVLFEGYVNVVNRTTVVVVPVGQKVLAGKAIDLVVRSDSGITVDYYGTIVAF